jgi:hypothetical protein
MWLRKNQAGSAPGHTWDEDGAVVEVDDGLGEELLALTGAGFSRAEASAIPVVEAPTSDEPGDEPDSTDQAAPKKRTRAKANIGTPPEDATVVAE